jgi:hypothetical protein
MKGNNMATYYMQARTKSGAEYNGIVSDLDEKEVNELIEFIGKINEMNSVSLEMPDDSYLSIKGDSLESLALMKL